MKFCVLFSLLLLSSSAFSMGIDEISHMAIERSSSLDAQEMESRALQSDASFRGRWQNPQVMGQFGSLKSGTENASTVEVSFTQPVPLSNKFSLRKQMTVMALENHKKQTDFFKNWISHQVLLASWKVYVTNELYKHGTERTRRLTLIKRYLETRPKVTIKQRVELSIVSSMLYQLEKMQDIKKHDYEISLNDIEYWLGKKITEADIGLTLPDQYNVAFVDKVDTTRDIEFLNAKNILRISQMDADLARKESRPDLFLGGGYRVENVAPVNHFSYAIVGLNIPLWDTGADRIAAARVREIRDQKNLEEMEKKLFLKQQKQVELVKLSIEQLKRFPKKYIPKNEEAIREAEVGFRQGLIDVNTFLLAETQSHEVIDQVFLSWLSYLENLSTFQLMKGRAFNWDQ